MAIRVSGTPYPCERDVRPAMREPIPGEAREEWDPFFTLDDRFHESLPWETHRFAFATDAYAGSNVA